MKKASIKNIFLSIAGRTGLILVLLALNFSALGVTPVHAASLVVTNANDSGTGSLRQAIADAAAGDTITFAGNYTILLDSELAISKNLIITGAGHNVTVSGQNKVRVFKVSTASVTFDTLTIAGSYASIGSLGGNGGGIYNMNSGALTVTNSTFSDNIAIGNGGGIYNMNSGALTVTNSTFSGNIASFGSGGGIYDEYADLTVINSTFSANSAGAGGGGILNGNSKLRVMNSTFSGNSALYGGGIFGAASITNTLLANNTDSNCEGGIADGGGNLQFGGTTADSCGAFIPTADPLLGALGNYGGSTQTIPLLPGSAAIDAGDSANCTTGSDQRGESYVGTCDIGAFESQGFTLAKTGGDSQSAVINTAFATKLGLTVDSAFGEPVNGGVVTFMPPGSGASAAIPGSPATIASDGKVSVSATANGVVGGPYSVTASAAGASSVNFALTNNSATPTAWITNSPVTYTGSAQTAKVACLGGGTAMLASGGTGTDAGSYPATVDCAASANYIAATGLSAGNFVIARATPVITWANPANIVSGTALGGAQLNATASIPGAFIYTPPAGTILTIGIHTLHMDFTPTDTVNYIPTSKDVSITVTSGGGGGGGGGLVPPTVIASDGTYLDKVNVTWTPISGASYYLAYRSLSLDGVKIPTSGYRATSLGGDDVWTVPGVTYYYWVKACDASGCSDFSAPDPGWQGLPAPVVTASDGAFPDKVQVTFPAVSWATSYLAYRSETPDGPKIPANGYFTTNLGGDDIWAAPGMTYYYWVKACNGPNCSVLSAYDTGWR